MGYSKIVYPEEESIEDSSALNQDNLILLTYYILAALASLIFFGILWDIWCWYERRKSQSTGSNTIKLLKEKLLENNFFILYSALYQSERISSKLNFSLYMTLML